MTNYEELHRAVYHLENYCENHTACEECHLALVCGTLPVPLTEVLGAVAKTKEKPKKRNVRKRGIRLEIRTEAMPVKVFSER